jgi:hypothetical protein
MERVADDQAQQQLDQGDRDPDLDRDRRREEDRRRQQRSYRNVAHEPLPPIRW